MTYPRQGEVWDVNLEPVVGREQQGTRRPALILSVDGFNATPGGLIVIVPITSNTRPLITRVRVDPPEGGLTVPSSILCNQIRSVDRQRLLAPRGSISLDTLAEVSAVIGRIISARRAPASE